MSERERERSGLKNVPLSLKKEAPFSKTAGHSYFWQDGPALCVRKEERPAGGLTRFRIGMKGGKVHAFAETFCEKQAETRGENMRPKVRECLCETETQWFGNPGGVSPFL